jgi:hypothetical protein
MKSLFVLALSLISVSAFAQGPGRGYPPGTKGNPVPNVQVVTVQPGSSTYIQALVPTQVYCDGSAIPTQIDPSLRCTIDKLTDVFGGVTYVVRQNGKELSNRVGNMDAALQDLTKLRNAGLCF